MTKKREASAPAEHETVREDFDREEWGNIELPGLSDEQLYSKNWDRSANTKRMMQTQSWQRAQKKMLDERIRHGFYQDLAQRNRKNKKRKQAMVAAGLKRRGKGNPGRERPCICEGVEYRSSSEAAKFYGINKKSMKDRFTHNPDAFYWKDEGPRAVLVWCYITPQGQFFTSKEMEHKLGMSVYKIKQLILQDAPGYDYKPVPRPSWNMNKVQIWQKGKARYEEQT